jgi:tetratricopeptide (TPR) repeat protein
MKPKAADANGMTSKEADLLLELSRQARWAYPTSQGRPVHWEDPGEWVEEMDREREQFTRAVAFFLARGREDAAAEVAANSWRLWVLARDYEGGRRFLAPVLKRRPRRLTKALALAWYGDSLFAMRLGDIANSRRASEAALRAAKSSGDEEALTLANLALSRVAFEDEDYERSLSLSREARRLARSMGPEFGQAPLFMEASSRRMLGDYDRAASLFRESVKLNRRIADKGMVMAELNNLSLVEVHRDRVGAAEKALDESEKMSPTEADDSYGQGMLSLMRGMFAYRRGEIQRAKSFLSRAKENFKLAGIEPGKDDKFEIDWLGQQLEKTD